MNNEIVLPADAVKVEEPKPAAPKVKKTSKTKSAPKKAAPKKVRKGAKKATRKTTKPTVKKAVRPAKHKKMAKRRPVPYEQIAKLWALKKTIPEIAKAIGRVGKGDDPYHSLRVVLTKMHKGYKNAEGKVVKLRHRVSPKTLKLATKAGRRAAPRASAKAGKKAAA